MEAILQQVVLAQQQQLREEELKAIEAKTAAVAVKNSATAKGKKGPRKQSEVQPTKKVEGVTGKSVTNRGETPTKQRLAPTPENGPTNTEDLKLLETTNVEPESNRYQ